MHNLGTDLLQSENNIELSEWCNIFIKLNIIQFLPYYFTKCFNAQTSH